jgi:sigma-54 specific flagellar transcriptional regulator A
LSMQVKLLRFLQERSYEAVGSTTAVSANIRVIAATHRDLQAEVAAGRFRQDLYYRLLVCPVALPALRNRPMDVPLLFKHFWDSRQETRPVDADVVDALMRYSWPGNVREMENMVERMSVCLDAPVITTACLSQFPQLQVDLGDTANADLPPMPPPLFLPVHAQAANSLPPTPVSSMPPSAVAFTTPPHGSAVAPFTMRATPSSIPVTAPPASPMAAPEAAPSDDYRDALLQLLTSRGLPSNMQGVLSWLENSMVDLALNATQGNRRHAAAMLGLQRTTLVEKLRRRERCARDERSDSGSMDTLHMQAAG